MIEISKSLISDLTTKNGNQAMFIYILRNRAHSFVAENFLADNWSHERSLHFRYYLGENSVEQPIALHV